MRVTWVWRSVAQGAHSTYPCVCAWNSHLLRQAAEGGDADAMYQAAMVLLFPSRRHVCDGHASWQQRGVARDTVAARQLLEMAAALGHDKALLELSFLVATGIGTGSRGGNVYASSFAAIAGGSGSPQLPLSGSTSGVTPTRALAPGSSATPKLLADGADGSHELAPASDAHHADEDTDEDADGGLQVEDADDADDASVLIAEDVDVGDDDGTGDNVEVRSHMGETALQAVFGDGDGGGDGGGTTAFLDHTPGAMPGGAGHEPGTGQPAGLLWGTEGILGAGLYHLAVAAGGHEAAVALAKRYQAGTGVVASEELAAYYAKVAAMEADRQHRTTGQQPHNEMNRLTEDNEETVKRGETGRVCTVVSADVRLYLVIAPLTSRGRAAPITTRPTGRGRRDHPNSAYAG